jgi:hypothetical protein
MGARSQPPLREKENWFDPEATPTRRFAIYLPSRSKDGAAIGNLEALTEDILEILCELFGGATSYPARGVFRTREGSLQGEEIRMVECFCESKAWDHHAPFLKSLLGVLARILDQETIGCALDGQLLFVPPIAQSPANAIPLDASGLKALVGTVLGADSSASPKR